jgi:hypothetical protein
MKTGRVGYWKPEAKNTRWQLFKPEDFQKVLRRGAMFRTWTTFSEPYQSNVHPEPHRYANYFPLDFDCEEDPEKALADMRTLCLTHLPEACDVDPRAIRFYASGAKGFHAEIPVQFFGAENGDPYIPLIFKQIAIDWAAKFGLKTLDLSLYNMKRGRMWRIPNVRRSNGRYKVPLTLEEVRDLPCNELLAFTLSPRNISENGSEPVRSYMLAQLYRTTQVKINGELEDRPKESKLSDEDRKRLSVNIPPCIDYILKMMPEKSDRINFNRLVMTLVSYFQTAGWDKEAVDAKVSDFLFSYRYSDTYATPEDRAQHWHSQWAYLEGNKDYGFDCKFVKSLGLPGSGFECKQCHRATYVENKEDGVD